MSMSNKKQSNLVIYQLDDELHVGISFGIFRVFRGPNDFSIESLES